MIAEPMVVYERADTLDQVLAAWRRSPPDPEAGGAERDAVHPAIESMAEDLARAMSILLAELLSAGPFGHGDFLLKAGPMRRRAPTTRSAVGHRRRRP